MFVVGMNTVGMKCTCATDAVIPRVHHHREVRLGPHLALVAEPILRDQPLRVRKRKQVMRPFWLLAPNPPRKYPLMVMSPNLGATDGGMTAEGGGRERRFGAAFRWRRSAR